jgi:glycosyltransferase involved in cell wall biosynthesis
VNSGRSGPESPPPTRPRLLVIPHIYAEDIAVREIELARRLTRRFDVFLMKWRDALHIDASSPALRRIRQLAVGVGAALPSRTRFMASHGMTMIQAPVCQPVIFQRLVGQEKALALCQACNARTLHKLVGKLAITHVLAANDLFGLHRVPGIRSFYDIVDWFPEECQSPAQLEKVRLRLQAIAAEMHGVFAVSQVLCEKLRADCGISAVPLPNGADLSRLRAVNTADVRALRERLRIHGKFVIGYIGNHGSYTGVDLLVNAFLAARSRLPQAVLLIVGPAGSWRELLAANQNSDVIATGAIPPSQMPVYFNALDVGVLAQGRTTGTEYAFQIKVVEYSACRKCVVSTPLLNWQRLAWPNVLLADANVDAWAEALVRVHSIRWQPAWDTCVEQFDWKILAEKAANLMLDHQPCAS